MQGSARSLHCPRAYARGRATRDRADRRRWARPASDRGRSADPPDARRGCCRGTPLHASAASHTRGNGTAVDPLPSDAAARKGRADATDTPAPTHTSDTSCREPLGERGHVTTAEVMSPRLTVVAVKDPVASARAARLHYSTDTTPGIRRVKNGKSFRFLRPDGKPVTNRKDLDRIRALVIPPAWTDVWISPDPLGHLQATGRDARGRKQYRYHDRWREIRDETKYGRMLEFGRALPLIRRRINADLRRRGLPRRRVLAAIVALLEKTLIRVGNEEYARDNQSFGLTTMLDRHVKVNGSKVEFSFRGKSGIKHTKALDDRTLAKVVKQCRDLEGQELFQYRDEQGRVVDIGSGDVNEYLKDITGEDFTS